MTEFEPTANFDATLASIKGLELTDLIKVMKCVTVEAEKRNKSQKGTKKGSMPKGVDPPQLKKPRAWVDFTRQHAQENGWEPFTIIQSKKDKTGEKTTEEVEMPGSVLHGGIHVFEGSIDAKNPNGKMLIHKHAMSLSKQRWAPKASEGTHKELYEQFISTYVADDDSEAKNEAKETALREKQEKATAKLAEKEEKKKAKDAEKEEKKKAKEALKSSSVVVPKAAVKAVKVEKAVKEAVNLTVNPEVVIHAKEVTKPVTKEVKPVTKEVKPAAKAAKAAKPAAKAWSCPNDDMVHHFPWKGKDLMRNFQNEVWTRGADGQIDKWQGMYIPAEDRIDATVDEPQFEEE